MAARCYPFCEAKLPRPCSLRYPLKGVFIPHGYRYLCYTINQTSYIDRMTKGLLQQSIRQVFRFALNLVLAGSPFIGLGQSLDSLERALATKRLTDSEKIRLYQDLSKGYVREDISKSLHFAKTGLDLALQTGDEQMEGAFYQNLGAAYMMKSADDSAEFYLEKALPIALRHGATQEAGVYRLYGSLYVSQNRYDAAMDYFKKSAVILEKTDNGYELCEIYARIGGIYRLLKNNDQALTYYKQAAQLAMESGNKEELASIYTDLGALYRGQEKPKEESIRPIEQALNIYRELGNKSGESRTLAVLASAYNYYGDYDAALPIAQQALQRAEAAGLWGLATSSATILTAIYYYSGNYSECIATGLKVLQMDSTDVNMTKHAYIHLSLAYGRLGRIDSMEHYVNEFVTALETQHNETFHRAFSEMEVKYETEKKSLQIGALEKQRRLYLWLGVAGGIVLLIALAFAVMRYRLAVSRRKLAEEAAQRLEQEKQLVAVHATLDGEAAERTRLAKDLHDGLGSMLSLVKFNLPQVNGDAVLEAVDVSRFQKALGMLDDSIQELRRVAHHMMPESLLRYGLKVSLSDFCAAIPTASFHYFGDEARLPGKLEIMVYRCVHELVNNALKHAGATQINVQLVQENDRLSFTVQDNGSGFDQKTVTEGMGLQNIRQRVAAFQGKMDCYSSAQGTEIHVELELTKNGQHD